jgi:hypothetical protein
MQTLISLSMPLVLRCHVLKFPNCFRTSEQVRRGPSRSLFTPLTSGVPICHCPARPNPASAWKSWKHGRCLAGIVSVSASDGGITDTVNLVITGDDLDNQIDIVRQAGQVKIIARGDTLLHYDLASTYNYGTVTPTYTEITFDASGGMRDVTIQMFSGNDDVRISVIGNHSFGNLLVSLGEGNNSFLLMGSSSTFPNINSVGNFFGRRCL